MSTTAEVPKEPAQPQSTTDSTASTTTSTSAEAVISIPVRHGSTTHTLHLPPTATLDDLSAALSTLLSIPSENQKLLVSPRPGLLKPPFSAGPHARTPLFTLLSSPKTKITLLGSTPAQLNQLNKSIEKTKLEASPYSGPLKTATPARRAPNIQQLHDATTYTFLSIAPLPYLPNPNRSKMFLERLATDPGIKATMTKHQWSVGLLTEMNPAEHTTHSGRTLGLNRNAGEVIELRLRTDAYDGYRDYKTIRKTLCHELTHNVFGDHDARFWELCRQVEKEVEGSDWKHRGRRLTEEAFYEGPERGVGGDEEVADHGAWQGRSYKVGEEAAQSGGESGGSSAIQMDQVMDRREVLARAAEERAKRLGSQSAQKKAQQKSGDTPDSGGRSGPS